MTHDAGTDRTTELEPSSASDTSTHRRWRKRITASALIVALVAAAVVIPPLVNIGRYQRR